MVSEPLAATVRSCSGGFDEASIQPVSATRLDTTAHRSHPLPRVIPGRQPAPSRRGGLRFKTEKEKKAPARLGRSEVRGTARAPQDSSRRRIPSRAGLQPPLPYVQLAVAGLVLIVGGCPAVLLWSVHSWLTARHRSVRSLLGALLVGRLGSARRRMHSLSGTTRFA